MKKMINVSKLYFRDFLLNTLIAVVSIISISIILTLQFKGTLDKSVGVAYQSMLKQTSSYVDNSAILQSQQFLLHNFDYGVANSDFHNFFSDMNHDMLTVRNTYQTLQLLCNNYPSIDSIILYKLDTKTAISSKTGSSFGEDNYALNMLLTDKSEFSHRFWIGNSETINIFPNENIFSYVATVYLDNNTYKPRGYVMLNFDMNRMVVNADHTYFTATDKNGVSVIDNRENNNMANYLSFFTKSTINDWTYATYIPKNMYYSDMTKTAKNVVLYSIIVILLIIILMYFTVKYINIPLKKLVNSFSNEDLSPYQLFELMSKKIENLQEMLDDVNSNKLEATQNKEEKMSKGLMQIIAGYTINNIDSDLSLGSVANHFGISEAHLSRAFKKEFNIGFLQFITDKKMEMAAKMLVDTENDFNVKDIANKLGYYSIQTFNVNFKKKYGVTPSQYKNLSLYRGM